MNVLVRTFTMSIVNYSYNYQTLLWEPCLPALIQFDREEMDATKEYISLNPHEFNVRTPSGPCIINMRLSGKLMIRGYNTIAGNPGEYFFDPKLTKFTAIEYWLRKIFPTPHCLQKFRDILGEIMYPLVNKRLEGENSSFNVINFIVTSSQTKSIMTQKCLRELIKIMMPTAVTDGGTSMDRVRRRYVRRRHGGIPVQRVERPQPIRRDIPGEPVFTIDNFEKITNTLWTMYGERRRWRRRHYGYWRRMNARNERRRRVGKQEAKPAVKIDYGLTTRFIKREEKRLSATRFINVKESYANQLNYTEFFKSYVKNIRPKKVVTEQYGVNPIRVVHKKMKLPSFICFSYSGPINLKQLGEMRQIANVMTVECRADEEMTQRSFEKDAKELRHLLQNWVIHGILDRLNRVQHESIGLIDIILEREDVVEPKPQRMYFMK